MQELYQYILDEIARFEPAIVYHFGSSVEGRERKDSDLDLAFYSRFDCDPYEVFTAAQRIARVVHRDVDLIDLGKAGDVMKAQVIGSGRCIYKGDERAADEFEMLALSQYARLNEERREILERQGVSL